MSEYPSYLIHYGIQGQHWHERRYQNEDGTYTEEGLRRRRVIESAEGDHAEGRSLVKSGAIETAAGTAKMAKAQTTIKREKNIKVSSIVMQDSAITPRKVKKITNA